VRRRAFISLLGGVAAWPLAAHAQQAAMPVVAFLETRSPDMIADRLRRFHQGLKDTGYVEGENVTIVYHWAENFDRLSALAAELVRRRVAVIVTPTTPAAIAAKAATTTVPIVFATGYDPVASGLVASLARPGGNLTGINFFNNELATKQLELLRELVPAATRVSALVNPSNVRNASIALADLETAVRARGMQIQVLNASTSREIDDAFATFLHQRPDALFVSGDGLFTSRRVQLVLLAMLHKVPAIFANREFAEIGGLMSYGANVPDAWHQVGVYVGRVLKGAKPADLPVVQASKFELVINHQTARMLGITVPQALLATADEVIE
jgi:putative tryptophan/tyrosine transport system substrate-binding protein